MGCGRRARCCCSRARLLTLEGTLKVVDPTFNLPAQATELVAREGLADIGSPEEILRHELVRALPALRTLPEHAETLAGQLRSGRLIVRSERYAGGDREVVNGWMDRVLVAAAGGIGAVTSGTVLVAGVDDLGHGRADGALDPRLLGPDREHGAADAHDRAEPARAVGARALGLTATGGRRSG